MNKNRFFRSLLKLEGKNDEIEFLSYLQQAIPADTYLCEFLKPEMISELQNRIRNDFPCDVWKDYQELIEEVEDLKRNTDNLATVIDERADDFIRNKLLKESVYEKECEIESMKERAKGKDDDILALKAKLYDLLM